ncbi:MAG: hypothetical protein LBU51_09845 [Bacteroidales bacterium]|nr:hypothetical protein [Bacteroidales bacterium]
MILFYASLMMLMDACKPPEESDFKATPYELELPHYFPTNLNIPNDNPLTVEGISLGEKLFHDGHLSGYTSTDQDSLMSCASCHRRENAFDVGIDQPRFPNGITCGRTGIPTPHSPMPLFNLIFNHEGYFWNGMIHLSNKDLQKRTIEDVVVMGILAPHEMNSTIERAVAAIKKDPSYPLLFKKAFGTEEITIDRICKAIAQYIRSLVSVNSKFDRYLQNSEQLTPQELKGYILFITEEGADCFHCHGSGGSPLFTSNLFYNNGLDVQFSDKRDRFAFTGNPNDRGAYRAPSLRNIMVTPPYMHDGRFKTIDEVLYFYNFEVQNSPYIHPLMHKVEQGGAMLTPSQIADLKAFLNTLTDEEFVK